LQDDRKLTRSIGCCLKIRSAGFATLSNGYEYAGSPADLEVDTMLLILVLVILLFWGGGFAMNVGGDVIHFLLVVALIVAAFHFFTPYGRRGGSSL
jgi:hypothetical protein